jgi:hypothetical protein
MRAINYWKFDRSRQVFFKRLFLGPALIIDGLCYVLTFSFLSFNLSLRVSFWIAFSKNKKFDLDNEVEPEISYMDKLRNTDFKFKKKIKRY